MDHIRENAFEEFSNMDYRTQSYMRAWAAHTLVKEGKEVNEKAINDMLFSRWLENKKWSQGIKY